MIPCPVCENDLDLERYHLECGDCNYRENLGTPLTVLGPLYSVRKDVLSDAEIKKHKKATTLKQEQYIGSPNIIPIWKEDDTWLHLPRQYGWEHFGPAEERMYFEPRAVGLEFHGELRPEQRKACTATLDNLARLNGGVLSAPTGSGKTAMSLYIACCLGYLPIVLFHKEAMFDDWQKEIRKFLKLDDDEIGIVQGPQCDLDEGVKILLGTIQSVSMKDDYPDELYELPGLVIADEVHRDAAETWHRAIRKFHAHFRLGISATPKRKDGLWGIIKYDVGPIIAKIEKPRVVPRVVTLNTDVRLPRKGMKAYMGGRLRMHLTKITNYLAEHAGRNAMILREIIQAAKTGRRIIALTGRRGHVEMLHERLSDRLPDGLSSSCFYGGLSEEERAEAKQADVLLATYPYAKEALDIPELDTLYLLTPRSDVEQAAGRIMRECSDKKEPLIIDIVDKHKMLRNMSKKRARTYSRLGCDIKTVYRTVNRPTQKI